MKIRSNVKAGGMQLQHNEKLASDINTIEQKDFGKKLRLSKETIRILKDGDLKSIAGGARVSGGPECSENCGVTIQSSCCP